MLEEDSRYWNTASIFQVSRRFRPCSVGLRWFVHGRTASFELGILQHGSKFTFSETTVQDNLDYRRLVGRLLVLSSIIESAALGYDPFGDWGPGHAVRQFAALDMVVSLRGSRGHRSAAAVAM